ncbi:MAG: DEAD/DEAH box helicase, partial [Acidimicrobiales bacterium]
MGRESKTLTNNNDTASDAPVKDEKPTISFAELGLAPQILKALDDLGYTTPTPIQAQAIPAALEGRDVLGIAQTGTGKTGAFTLPVLHRMSQGRARARMPRCLIVCPTRELAAQVAENVELYGKHMKISMALLIGGVSFKEQEIKLNRGVDVLIATPGRLLDQFERGKILLTGVQALVVDEADRMLDMGFIPDIEKIFNITPFTRQVLFFSATMPNEIKKLVDQFLHQPHQVQIARQNMTAKTVRQRIVMMPANDTKQKRTALRHVIDSHDVKQGIVFCNRKRDVDIVAKSLTVHGHNAAPIHGDLAQSLRTKTLDDFKSGDIQFLVASDVAARGLDVPTVEYVLNYDVPNHSEDYVHRIGRTGRAGRKGDAVMFVTPYDRKNYAAILELIKVKEIEELEIDGIEDFPKESRGRGRSNEPGKGRGRGRGQSQSRGRGRSDNRKPDNRERSQEHKSKKPAKDRSDKPEKTEKTEAKKPQRSRNDRNDRSDNKKKPVKSLSKDNKTGNRKSRGGLPENNKSGF